MFQNDEYRRFFKGYPLKATLLCSCPSKPSNIKRRIIYLISYPVLLTSAPVHKKEIKIMATKLQSKRAGLSSLRYTIKNKFYELTENGITYRFQIEHLRLLRKGKGTIAKWYDTLDSSAKKNVLYKVEQGETAVSCSKFCLS